MKIANLFFAAICCVMLGASHCQPIKQCIDSLPRDTDSFDLILAANHKYLVVGVPFTNYMVVYTREQDGKWGQPKEIVAPKDSTAHKVGSGFGRGIALDGDVLTIGTLTHLKPEDSKLVNPKDLLENIPVLKYSSALYQTRLDRETKVEWIDLPDLKTEGVINNGAVVADNGKIGFVLSQYKQKKRVNQVYVLSNGNIRALSYGRIDYTIPSKAWTVSIFGSNIALKKNNLLVSINRDENRGGAWLFDLDSPQSKPRKIAIPLDTPAINSVAISEQFIVIGNSVTSVRYNSSHPFQKTLIQNIATGSTKIIDRVGFFSLDGNILARTLSTSEELEEYNVPRVLEVYRLEDDATPHLIKKLDDVEQALVQNRLLITVQKTASGRKICTEQVR